MQFERLSLRMYVAKENDKEFDNESISASKGMFFTSDKL